MPRAVLVYDGDCGFCTAAARWIEARWPEGADVAATSSQRLDPALAAAAGVAPEAFGDAAYWLEGTRARRGADAVAAALVASGGALGVLGRLLELAPVAMLAEPAYRVVARNRHRLPGATPACRI